MTRGARCVVIGIGNPDRGDDGAGRAVARALRDTLPPDVSVVEHDGEASSLMSLFDGADAVYLVDACLSAAAPGSLVRIDAAAAPLPEERFAMSTHGLGLAEAVELARALGQLPRTCIVYGIEAASFEAGTRLSQAVAACVPEVAERLRIEVCGVVAAGTMARRLPSD